MDKISREVLEKYFDFSYLNDEAKLFSSGEVEYGKHGFFEYDGEYYASLYHLKTKIAKGEIKKVLENKNTYELGQIGIDLFRKFPNSTFLSVKYESLSFEIKQYPLSIILRYFVPNFEELNAPINLINDIQIDDNFIRITDISVSNFGKFKEEIELNFNKINFLVGPNNGGKSTIIRALRILSLICCQNTFKEIMIEEIYNSETDILIKNSETAENELINISYGIEDLNNNKNSWRLTFFLKENKKEKKLEIIQFIIENNSYELHFDSQFGEITYSTYSYEIGDEIEKIKNRVKSNRIIWDSFDVLNEIKKIMESQNDFDDVQSFIRSLPKLKNFEYQSPLFKLNSNFDYYNSKTKTELNQVNKSNDKISLREKYDWLIENGLGTQGNSINTFFRKWISNSNIDENDIQKGFGIGEGFEIGEENKFYITDGNSKMLLQQMGIGSQRIFDLLVGMAFIIFKEKGFLEDMNKVGDEPNEEQLSSPFILIEEPESHLHPNLQSQLTYFFHELNLKYGLRFIIETHSEYLLRMSQLIAMKENYINNNTKSNPFVVVYSDRNVMPKNIEYQSDGYFKGDFGKPYSRQFYGHTIFLSELLRKNRLIK